MTNRDAFRAVDRALFYLLWAALALVCGLTVGSAIGGCSSFARTPCSIPGATRCADTRLELCAPDSVWIEVQDCNDLAPGEWACSEEGCTR